MYFFKKKSSLLRGMMTKEGSTEIVYLRTPDPRFLLQERGHISHIVKIHYFSKNLLSTPRHGTDKLSTYILLW